ncbi:hypothetical protein [Sulfurospirillum diekertiae]|uniref:General glycosylation pathway protein n=1 Tax=Sulfurospirillum diekertiae TaxID=1854492 RepID=A0A1Y0HLM5_9BACT|nr:hypothetical protein [Sulfurospirillum diekertiae]ARU48486.1 hypothetical protein Sdiek1_1322 [Sulfurospirillum diekertiae]ASC93320.1 hypothetical protein Sdiek2_1301 [Sulfurospirillum diekertiae]
MQKLFTYLLNSIHLFAALILIVMSLLIMGWAVYEVIASIPLKGEFIPRMLQSVGAIVISAAIIDVAQYMIEEEVFMNKELRDPREARRTLTKIIVIITIAVSIEGLVYIFKAGTENMALLIYPAWLLFVSAVLIVSLGVYQKLSATIEQEEKSKIKV